ncbi:MAG TPA: hypothetical protein VKA04_08630 [Pseudodesulfovibrio sp.]|nr:hypothetical protein [Pseudodesulfovibrio sp.]
MSIKPALTAEEWDAYNRGLWFQGDGDYLEPLAGVRVFPLSFHAEAAMRLEGEPYGFTREMLDGILGCINDAIGAAGNYDDAELAQKAADRIAALLPPEEK